MPWEEQDLGHKAAWVTLRRGRVKYPCGERVGMLEKGAGAQGAGVAAPEALSLQGARRAGVGSPRGRRQLQQRPVLLET